MTSVFVDSEGRITAINPGDLRGNTGWERVRENINEPITNTDGVALYKFQNGHAVSRTAEEIAADTPEPEPPYIDPVQQQLDEQADALIELAALIGGE